MTEGTMTKVVELIAATARVRVAVEILVETAKVAHAQGQDPVMIADLQESTQSCMRTLERMTQFLKAQVH